MNEALPYSRAGILNFGTTDIWGRKNLCWGSSLSWAWQDPRPMPTRCQEHPIPSVKTKNVTRLCYMALVGVKSPPVKNHCSRASIPGPRCGPPGSLTLDQRTHVLPEGSPPPRFQPLLAKSRQSFTLGSHHHPGRAGLH